MKRWEMWKDVIVSETYQTGHTFKEALENNFKNCSIRYDDTYVWIIVNDEAVSTAEVKLVDIYEDLKEQIEEMKKKPDLKEYFKKYRLNRVQKNILTDFHLKNAYYLGFAEDLDALANCLHENKFSEEEFKLFRDYLKDYLKNEDIYMISVSEHESFDDLTDENRNIYFHHVYVIDNVDDVVEDAKTQLYYGGIENADINIFKVSWDGDRQYEDLTEIINIEFKTA